MESRGSPALFENSAQTGRRNYGIDLLRCVSMLMIVIIHIYNRGGLIAKTDQTRLWYLDRGLLLVCLGAVNLYAMISGYVMLNGSFRLRKLISLWMQVVLIGVLLCAIGELLAPQTIGREQWHRALMPITQKEFWYFSAYAGVFLLTPIVNRGIRALSQKQAFCLLVGCVLLFSVGSILGYALQGDPYGIASGYSVLWLLVLYVIGACLKHTQLLEKRSTPGLLCTMAVCFVLSIVYYWVCKASSNALLHERGKLAFNYVSPLMLIFDIGMFGLFARMNIKRKAAQKLIAFLASLTFSVYVIHVHPLP